VQVVDEEHERQPVRMELQGWQVEVFWVGASV
jgi:hypothetical protein